MKCIGWTLLFGLAPLLMNAGLLTSNYANDYAILAGTRSITYTMEFQLEKGTNIDSFVDDNVLDISGSATAPTPEPSRLGIVFAGTAALCAGELPDAGTGG